MTKLSTLGKLAGLLAAVVLLVACRATPTTAPPTDTVVPTDAAVLSSPLAPTDTPGPTDTVAPPVTEVSAGPRCIGVEAGGGQPPMRTEDLTIKMSVPIKNPEPVIAYFREIARDCDGLGLLGRFAERIAWQEQLADLPHGIVFYSLPSLDYARQTANAWVHDADWFAYEITLGQNTPDSEKNDPAQASQAALEFARQYGLGYTVTPGRPVTVRHAAEVAQYADAYGLQAYGEQRESPATYIQLVKDTSDKIRAVNPDILLFVGFSTDLPEDDPQVAYDLITQLLGYIDGVFIRTSEDPASLAKLKTLVTLLRAEQ